MTRRHFRLQAELPSSFDGPLCFDRKVAACLVIHLTDGLGYLRGHLTERLCIPHNEQMN
jgi:hypothetical protein